MKTTKRILLILCAMFMASQPVLAQNDEDTRNKAVITTDDGDRQLITDEISVIRFDGPKVTVVQPWGDTVFDRTLRSLTFLRPLPGTLRLTVNLNTDEDAGSTRGHSIDGNGYLASTWSENDRVYVYADAATTTSLGTLKPATTGGKVSKMTGDITATNLTNGQKLYLSTQPRTHIFASQTGDVEDAAMFYLTAESTVTINGGNATTANATFQMAQAVLKVTLKDGSNNDVSVKSLVITGSTETITVTPTSATNILYVALPAKASTNYSFTATDNNNREWTGSKTAALDNGKYYRTTVTMTKTMLNPSVTAPTAVTSALTYSGSAQKLFNIGSTSGGTLMYKVTTSNSKPTSTNGFKTTIDQGTNVGTYYLWYYVEGDEDYYGTGINTMGISKTISPASASVTAPTAVTGDLTYSGSTQTLFNAGSSSDGTLRYKVTTENTKPTSKTDFKTTIDQGTNAGTYYLWYYVVGNANHNDTEINAAGISKAIAKKLLTVTANAQSRSYGQANPTLTYTHGDLATGDNESSVFSGELTCAATTTSEPGEYDITQGTLSAGDNYEISYTGAKLTVNLLDMSSGVTVTPYSAAYDGNAHGITIVLSGAAEGATITYCDTENDTYRAENYTYSGVAPARTVWYKIEKEHYTTITGSSTVTITQASNSFTTQPTITGWTYGQSANAPTGGVASFGTSTITYKYCATENGEYGTYDAIVNGQAGTWYVKGFVEATTNYAAATSNAVSFTISAAAMEGITATAYSAAYDGNAHGITLNNVPDGATVSYGETDGTYDLTVAPTYTDVAAERTVYYKVSKTNYADFTGSSTVTITQASNSFTTQPTITGWTYGQSANAPTDGVASFGTITYKYCATENGDYGTYDAIVNGQAGTWYVKGFVEATTNYAAATSNAVSFTISAAAGSISYTTPAVEKTLAAPAFTNSLTKVGDGTVSYARSAGDDICTVNATTGLVTLNGTAGTCTITATVANSTNYSYDTHTASYTLTVLPVLDLSLVTANMTVPNGVTVTGTLGGNYKISIAEDATVTLSNAIIERGSNSNWQWAGLNCVGDATIILADGTTNTVKGFHENYPGIHIPSGNTLTIQGTGALNASSNGKGAGIGGGRNISCGIIIINGGIITASGGSYAAGIGSGGDLNGSPNCGDITINGGTIMATGGSRGAGIGSAFGNGSCGNITISGGIVTATGGTDGGAGIGGGGYNGRCGDITISGGEVTATGGGGDEGATGIGSGRQSSYNSITISGGTVIANGGTNGAGIGTGYCANGGDILISGGTVTATGSGNYSVGIGAGYGSNYHCGNITIENTVTRVTATKSANAVHSIGICYNGRSNCGTVSIGGNVGAISTSPYTYSPAIDLATISSNYTAQDHDILTGTLGSNVQISVAAGARITLRNATISSGNYAGLTCLGSATITLQGSNTMTGAWAKAGIQIGGTGTTLTIEGPGSLQANGGGQSAGIGIGRAWDAGTVTGGNIVINGGTVTAQGGSQWGAGIGTGAAYATAVTIGNITINGGEVTATGGSDGGAAGIGTSYTYSNASTNMGNITINGGTVNATGNGGAAGIGTGESNGSPVNKVGSITIINTVTRVTATKGPNATHSIGKGASSSGFGTVTIGGVDGAISTSPYTYQPPASP